mgnify:CR=1 FL=1
MQQHALGLLSNFPRKLSRLHIASHLGLPFYHSPTHQYILIPFHYGLLHAIHLGRGAKRTLACKVEGFEKACMYLAVSPLAIVVGTETIIHLAFSFLQTIHPATFIDTTVSIGVLATTVKLQ